MGEERTRARMVEEEGGGGSWVSSVDTGLGYGTRLTRYLITSLPVYIMYQ